MKKQNLTKQSVELSPTGHIRGKLLTGMRNTAFGAAAIEQITNVLNRFKPLTVEQDIAIKAAEAKRLAKAQKRLLNGLNPQKEKCISRFNK